MCSALCLMMILGVGYYLYRKFSKKPTLPIIETERWWGPGSPQEVDTSVRPFKIEFKDEMIADLRNKLAQVTLTPPLEDVGFEYGFNSKYLSEVISFWSKDYNFKEREAYLNQYDHFKTNIQGLDIHFIHVKPKDADGKKVLPLLLLHGWPGSVREFYDVIPILTTPRNDQDFVFELIIPSLPGYGFSQAAAKPGFGVDRMAVVLRNLMVRLGFKRYCVQGGDWGAGLSRNISVFFPTEVIALHTNLASVRTNWANFKWLLGSLYTPLYIDDKYKHRLYPVMERIYYIMEEFGYMHLQATKPDSVGVALRDSPAGLAAYILEKFSTWTNLDFKKLQDGGLTRKYTLTNLLDNITIYWSTGCITTSMRLYSESMNKRVTALKLSAHPVTVPSAIANFKHEISYTPEADLRSDFINLVQLSHFEDGGHFAAFEVPKLLAEDIWSAVSKVRQRFMKD